MLNLKLITQTCNHSPIEIWRIIGNDSFWQPISKSDISLQKFDEYPLCYTNKRTGFHPLGEIINCHQDEAMPIDVSHVGCSLFPLSSNLMIFRAKRWPFMCGPQSPSWISFIICSVSLAFTHNTVLMGE